MTGPQSDNNNQAEDTCDALQLNLYDAFDDSDDYEALHSGDELEMDDGVKLATENIVIPTRTDFDDSDGDSATVLAEFECIFNEEFVNEVGGFTAIQSGLMDSVDWVLMDGIPTARSVDIESYLDGPYSPATDVSDYPGLKESHFGPSPEVVKLHDDPLVLFLCFMPVSLWNYNAAESNRYHYQMIDKRSDAWFAKQQKKRNVKNPKTKSEIKSALLQALPIRAYELLRIIGLLIARAISPNREKFNKHWQSFDEGAISRGSFSSFMSRDRFWHLMRDLHFNDNDDANGQKDRIWKIKLVVDVLQSTFKKVMLLRHEWPLMKKCYRPFLRTT